MPKVSVVMPAYNAETYIGEAIGSILRQTFRDFELIVINDASADATERIILSFQDDRIVYVRNEKNMGVARTLNRGLSMAKGEYIARMDADDISLPERFRKQTAFLDENPQIAVVGAAIEMFGDGEKPERRCFSQSSEAMKVDLFFSCGLAHPSVMMRKSVIAELGGYDPAFEGLEDYQLWCRVAREHGITTLPDLLFRYRVHGGQVTKNPSTEHRRRFQALKAWQLEQLGLPEKGALADCYYDLCQGKYPDTKEKILTLAAFFESALEANRTGCQYEPALLERAFRGILLSAAAELNHADAEAVCAGTPLVDRNRLRRGRFRRTLRRLLRR